MADTNTPNLGLLIADLNDVFNFGLHVENNFSTIDSLMGAVQCTSTTRPSNTYAGQIIYETDSKRYVQNTGTKASPIWTYMSHQALSMVSSAHATSGLTAGELGFDTDTQNAMIYSGSTWETLVHVGAWNSYTPVWSAAGTQPAKGNGNLSGRWTRKGRAVTVQIGLNAGTTTTFGSGGTWNFTLPLAVANTVNGQGWVGSAYAQSNAAFNRAGVFIVQTGASTGYVDGDNLNGWTNSSPQTWANGDSFSFNVTYETSVS